MIGECRDLGDDATTWRQHFFARLGKLAGADLVVGGEKGELQTGVGVTLGTATWGFEEGFNPAGWHRSIKLYCEDPNYSPTESRYLARTSGDGSALARSDLVSDEEWYQSADYQEVFRTIGIDHIVWCYRPVSGSAGELSAVLVTRGIGNRDFSAREKALIQEAHAQIGPLVGQALARFTEPSPSALPLRAREVLRCLLEGDGDKQIAARLRISPYTVNVHTKAIYYHFGVRGRAELLARWIRRGWGSRCAWADSE